MTDELHALNTESLHSAYLNESQRFVVALQSGANASELTQIRVKMKLIMEIIEKREQDKINKNSK
jgi:hypothetical protein